ncbi:hypothetical protein RMATCC62417_04734 [Rhizopus microsporus]|nr:hypothetical protein RMATCC62417_04734 [Rhizopus microsporus]
MAKLHSKKCQREEDSTFPSVVNSPVRWMFGRLGRERSDPPPKCPRITQDRDQYLMDAFMEQLEIQHSSYICHCYQTGENTDALF